MGERQRTPPPEWLDAAVELMGRSGRGGVLPIQGRSMVPTIEPGQRVSVEFVHGPFRRGDLLLFRQMDYLVVHRLLGRSRRRPGQPDALRLRGDGVSVLDPPVEPSRVVGRVRAIESPGGVGWRSIEGRWARAYAGSVAAHALVWAALAVVARLGDRAVARLGAPTPFARWTAAMDRGLLGFAHRALFRTLHPSIPPPRETGET